jgi:GNAT superfamily N-acetyltransferase
MTGSTIQRFQNRDRDAVLDVLTEAYRTDPWCRVWFGSDGGDRLSMHRAWWSFVLAHVCGGTRYVAVREGSVVGFVHWQQSPACQPSAESAGALRAALLAALEGDVLSRMAPFLRLFRDREPDAPHAHFGPFAVHPTVQGRGLGRALIGPYCEELDRTSAVGHLETSTPDNVRFYSRCGFEVSSEAEIERVRAWFMRRRQHEFSGTTG